MGKEATADKAMSTHFWKMESIDLAGHVGYTPRYLGAVAGLRNSDE